jgi:hypothetical protein
LLPIYNGFALALKPKERIWSFSYVIMLMQFCKDLSYRSAAYMMNRVLHRSPDQELKPRTLADFIEHFGNKISAELKRVSNNILQEWGFDSDTNTPLEEAALPAPIVNPSLPDAINNEILDEHINQINEQRETHEQIKHVELADKIEPSAERCCYISIDDIGVKHQKEQRTDDYVKDKKYVQNTVIHVQSDGLSYYLTAIGLAQAFSVLMAFLLDNKLMEDRRLVFFTDGARDIKSYIESVFSFRQFTIVLDWYHLKKKCKELISSSIKGIKSEKQEIIRNLLRMLWVGNTDEAISYLNGLDSNKVKSVSWRDELVGYLERKTPDIACYALRFALGLRISSNRVEKANDTLVAKRQKHNGMSWSFEGSGALAAITMSILNNEIDHWVRSDSLPFTMPRADSLAA